MDFHFVTPRLAIGGSHGMVKFADIEELQTDGITHAINLRTRPELHLSASKIVTIDNGVADDGLPKEAAWFKRSIQFALFVLARPRTKVLCNCFLGKDRSASTALAILVAQGWPPEMAEAAIRLARPVVTLAYLDDAIRAVRELGYS